MITSIFHVDPQVPSPNPSFYTLHSASPEPGFDLRLRLQLADCKLQTATRRLRTGGLSPIQYIHHRLPSCITSDEGHSSSRAIAAYESRVIFVAGGLSHIHETPQKAGLLFITRVA